MGDDFNLRTFSGGVLFGVAISALFTWGSGANGSLPARAVSETKLDVIRTMGARDNASPQSLAALPVGTHEKLKMEALFESAMRTGYDAGDKLSFWQHNGHSYEHYLTAQLAPIRMQKIKFLEIGLGCNMKYGAGRSLKLWSDYLPAAEIWMAEYNQKCIENKRSLIESVAPGRVKLLVGSQAEVAVLQRWLRESGGGFDFIIDDGSHRAADMWLTLVTLWSGLAPGGVIILEDLGETSFPRNVLSWRKSPFSNSTRTPNLMAAVSDLLTNLVSHGGGVSKRTNRKARLAPGATWGSLPGLKSIQCFAESCAFVKCSRDDDRVTRAARCP